LKKIEKKNWFEKNKNQIWHKKPISIKKMIRKTKHNNQKNKNQIWYKNQISRDQIEKY
jgi:hypothetical protein